jgi:hypothetical protein
MEPTQDLAAKDKQQVHQAPHDVFAELDAIRAQAGESTWKAGVGQTGRPANRDNEASNGHSQDEPDFGTGDEP